AALCCSTITTLRDRMEEGETLAGFTKVHDFFYIKCYDYRREYYNIIPIDDPAITNAITSFREVRAAISSLKYLTYLPKQPDATDGADVLEFLQFVFRFPVQEKGESLFYTWERYNDLLFKCPFHDLNDHQKVNTCYSGLRGQTRRIVDSNGLNLRHNEESKKDTLAQFNIIIEKFKVLNLEMDELKVNIHKINMNGDKKSFHEEIKSIRTSEINHGFAKNLRVFIGYHQFLIDFIILENVNEFVEKGLTKVLFGQSFKEQVRIIEDRVKGVLWFKRGDDKTVFNMPHAEKRFGKLTLRKHNTMGPILKFSDKDKFKGIHQPYQKIKGFYKGCLELEGEYKHDQEVIDWIKRVHVSIYKMT
nr:callose synthase 9 [Tanacetum cinerariifolium]